MRYLLVFSCSAIGQLHIGSYLMISANQLSSGRATGEVIPLRDSGEVIHLRDRGALVIWHLPLGHLLIFFFLIGNVFLVDGASWVSLSNISVEVSPKILLEETFMSFLSLMCNFMERVYSPWGNRLRIYQVLGCLMFIGVSKTSKLFLITFFHVKCLFLNSLSPSQTPTRKRVVESWND